MTEPAVRAGIYCRMSLAIMGDTTKIEDQERICRQVASQRGWQVAEGVGHPQPNGAYLDNSKSAWQRRIRRPGWEAMLKDVETGKINAVITYHGDRLVRQPRDLEKLIDLAEGKGIRIASPTGTRNLDNRDDRAMARVIAAFAENEAAATSERRKNQYARWRREGRVRPGGRGGRAFGFATDGLTHLPDEADLIRGAAERILAAQSPGLVARWLNDSGARTSAKNPFSAVTVRKMLARPRYAGLMPDGVSKAAWEPVLPRETWESVVAVLDGRAGLFTYSTNVSRYLLTGIARCGICAGGMWVHQNKGRAGQPPQKAYACRRGSHRSVYRSQPLLDAYVTRRVVNRLNHPDTPAGRIPEAPGLAAEFAALAEARAEVEAAMADHTRGRLPLLLARLDSLDKRLAELREVAAGDAAARLRGTHAGITGKEFGALPLQVRRSLVAACFTVRVLPSSKRGPGFRTEDVEMTPL